MAASSGGFCAELARLIIRMGGIVFGVALEEDFRARYIEVRSEEDLWKIRGSKYVQACPNDCFRDIAQRLKENKTVLFVGTSCQVRALKTRFLQASPRLISVNIACYGVPSYHLLDAYMRELNTGTDRVKQLAHMGISCLICHTQPGSDLVSRLHESASFPLSAWKMLLKTMVAYEPVTNQFRLPAASCWIS